MRRSLLLLSVTLGCAAALWGDSLPDRTLSLDDSVRLALNNSHALLNAREDVNIALQRVRETQALFFPRLDLNANWSKFRVQDDTPLLLQPALGTTLIPRSPRENFYTTRANIYQSVYEGGRSKNLWRQARISYERARSANDALQTQVAASAKQAFYDLLFARERVRFLSGLIKTSESMSSREGGSLSEQLRLESELSSVQTRASEAIRNQRESERAYVQALGLEMGTTVDLKGTLETHSQSLDLSKLLAWSTQYRTELRQTEFQQELDALGISLSLSERQPTVGFGASYERSGNDLDVPTANWAGTLNVNLPVSISDFFYGWAKVRERRAQYRQATVRRIEVQDQIQLQVRQAYDACEFWQAELGPRRRSLERMEELLETLRRQKSRPFERLEAERLTVESGLRWLEAVHGHLVALATIERAVGRPLNEER